MTAAISLRMHAAEASQAFERAIEDADDAELVTIAERVAWAVLIAAEAARRKAPGIPHRT